MIKVLFFGFIAAKLAKSESLLPAREGLTLKDVVAEVGCAAFKPLLLAVNQEQENDLTTTINDGDEVAIMPPFSGG